MFGLFYIKLLQLSREEALEMRLRKPIIHRLNFRYRKYVTIFQFKLKMAIHTAHTKKKLCEVNNFWYFLNSYFIFSRRVSFPFKCSKAIFWRSRKQNVKVSPLTWTIVMPHGNNEFSKLLNLFPVKIFSLILTPGSAHVSVKTKSQVGSIWVKDTKK